jgi:drug/metabolite transporter (DMT)-like permease
MMPIAEAGAGLFTSPIFVLLFSAILFSERIGIRRILAVAVGSLGVWCVLQPGAEGVTIYQLMPILAGPVTQSGRLSPIAICKTKAHLRFCSAFSWPLGSVAH